MAQVYSNIFELVCDHYAINPNLFQFLQYNNDINFNHFAKLFHKNPTIHQIQTILCAKSNNYDYNPKSFQLDLIDIYEKFDKKSKFNYPVQFYIYSLTQVIQEICKENHLSMKHFYNKIVTHNPDTLFMSKNFKHELRIVSKYCRQKNISEKILRYENMYFLDNILESFEDNEEANQFFHEVKKVQYYYLVLLFQYLMLYDGSYAFTTEEMNVWKGFRKDILCSTEDISQLEILYQMSNKCKESISFGDVIFCLFYYLRYNIVQKIYYTIPFVIYIIFLVFVLFHFVNYLLDFYFEKIRSIV